MNIKFIFSVILSSIVLTACGGGGGGGSSTGSLNGFYQGATNPATVTNENSSDISENALLGTSKTLKSGEAPEIPRAANIDFNDPIIGTLDKITENIASRTTIPTGFVSKVECEISGETIIDFVGVSRDAQSVPSNGTILATFNNCKNDDGLVINGTGSLVYNGLSAETGEFDNFTYVFDLTIDGEPFVGTIECSNSGLDCEFSESFSQNGVSYKIEDQSVTGNNTQGYNISFEIYDSRYGYIDVVATGITIDEETGNICTGTITIEDSTSEDVMTITFPDCDSFVVTFEGNATTYMQ